MSLGLKVTPDIKNKLDAAASANGRTQSQEAETRLERSFDRQSLAQEVLELRYGAPLAGLLMAIGAAMENAGRSAVVLSQLGKSPPDRLAWEDDPFAYNQARNAADRALALFAPAGDPAPPQRFPNAERTGANAADGVLCELPPAVPIFPDLNPRHVEAATMRRALGEKLIGRLPTSVFELQEEEPPE